MTTTMQASHSECDTPPPAGFGPGNWKAYDVTLAAMRDGHVRHVTVPFFCGELAGEPTAEDVHECLVSELSVADMTYADYLADFGLIGSPETRQAWQATKALGDRVRSFLEWVGEEVTYT